MGGIVQMRADEARREADAARPERRARRPAFERREPRDTLQGPSLPVRLDLAALSRSEPARPRFVVDEILPIGYATLFAGDGGTGKSALALFLAACVALGRPVWGIPTLRVPVMFLSFEDRADVLHWRLAHIAQHLGISIADLAGHLHLLDGVDVNATLFAFDSRKGREVTGLYEWVADQIEATGSRLLVVDGVSDVNAASEIDRAAVKAFVRSMTQLTGPDGSVLLIGHVDKTAARNGDTRQGYSGSTGWNNSVRARWYLRPETQSDDEGKEIVVPGRLVLEVQKANLAPTGRTFGFAWSDEARMFLPDDAPAEPAATLQTARSGPLHDWVVSACDNADRAGDAIPAALNGGQRTAWSVLTARLDCPAEFKGRPGRLRLAQVIEQLRSDSRLISAGRRRANRHLRECLVTRVDPSSGEQL